MNPKKGLHAVPKEKTQAGKRTSGVLVDEDRFSLLLWNVNRLYCKFVHRFSWQGSDPLPLKGPAILVCNHRSSVDPFILSATTRRVISYLVAREYCQIPVMGWLLDWMRCVPVRRDRQEVGSVRRSLAELKNGRLLCVFPEGGIGRGFEDPHLGMGYLSLKSGAPVIPAYVSGTPTSPSVWKALFTRSRSCVTFGAVCQPPRKRAARLDREQVVEWTDRLMRAVKDLMAEDPR
jgi:1-acyl-sn-glycerol-3-phosphate acyltransferase